jgi:hypothetical protein
MGRNYVLELWLPVGLLFIPQRWYEYAEPRWNDTDWGETKNLEKNLS